ncbi:MAG: hypothetical protein PHC28_11705 [Flavobacterium sp.]|uniref:hypothetical protein n=1 Tax=Flavobacterium sp. TaxID=239 RepID=UPI00260EB15B|nr:hypothetical protein [Flavobacterium sp.]MDD5151118.1 hypothetical protein [Flavobacterium sp.]
MKQYTLDELDKLIADKHKELSLVQQRYSSITKEYNEVILRMTYNDLGKQLFEKLVEGKITDATQCNINNK